MTFSQYEPNFFNHNDQKIIDQIVFHAKKLFETGYIAELKLRFAYIAAGFPRLCSPSDNLTMQNLLDDIELFDIKGKNFFEKAFNALLEDDYSETLILHSNDSKLFNLVKEKIENFEEYEEGFDDVTLSDLKQTIIRILSEQAEHYLQTFPPIKYHQSGQVLYSKTRRFLQFKDANFSYDINQIDPDYNIFVGSGPQTYKDIVNLIRNTVFNSQKKISDIIALGDKINCGDFLNYFAYPAGHTLSFGTETGVLKVKIKHIEGEWQTLLKPFPEALVETEIKGEARFVKSVLEVTDENGIQGKVIVHFFKVRDNCPLHFIGKASEEIDQIMKITSNIMIHCASGIGRSGELALTILLNKKFPELKGRNILQTAQKIAFYLIERRQSTRPALVNMPEQFESAVRKGIRSHINDKLFKSDSASILDRSSPFYYNSSLRKSKSMPTLLLSANSKKISLAK